MQENRWEGEGESFTVEAPASRDLRSQTGSLMIPVNSYDPEAKTTVSWNLKWPKRSLK